MKKLNLLLILMLCVSTQAWGLYRYYNVDINVKSTCANKGGVSGNKSLPTSPSTGLPAYPSGASTTTQQITGYKGGSGVTAYYAFAKPADGYKFVRWENAQGDEIGSNFYYQLDDAYSASADKAADAKTASKMPPIYAVFQASSDPTTVDLIFAKPVGGSYAIKTESGSTHSIKTTMTESSENYPANGISKTADKITLQAIPKRGYEFVGWYLGTTLLSSEKLYYNKNFGESGTVTASFQALTPFNVTYYFPSSYTEGIFSINYMSINGSGTKYTAYSSMLTGGNDVVPTYAADEVTLTPSPKRGFNFKHWVINKGGNETQLNEIKSENITEACTIKPVFESPDPEDTDGFNVRYTTPSNGNYTIKYKYSYIDGSGNVHKDYQETISVRDQNVKTYGNDSVFLTATPSSNYVFVGWYNDGELLSTNANYKGHITANWVYNESTFEYEADDITIEARFSLPYEVTFASSSLVAVSIKDVNNNSVTLDTPKSGVSPSTAFTASYSNLGSNYEFIGWYIQPSGSDTKIYLSKSATVSQTLNIPFAGTVYADVVSKTAAPVYFDVNNVRYESIPADFSGKLVLANNATLSQSLTIPATATLLIPNNDTYEVQTIGKENTTRVAISQYRKLTLVDGAEMIVNGAVCIAAEQYGGSNSTPGPGSVNGAYGCIDMSQGGEILVNNGGKLYVQGFIFGSGDQSASGTITVKNGGEVFENIVIQDMHGGGGTAATVNGDKASNNYDLFPFNQYYIQNIEPKMTIEYGGTEKVAYDISAIGLGKHDYCNFIGSTAQNLFSLSSNGSVTKWYDATRDYQCFSLIGTVNINELSIYASEDIGLISSNFVLPLTNNMDIELQDGAKAYMSKKSKMLPGSRVHIAEGATLYLSNELYVYDCNDWDYFALSTSKLVMPMDTKNSPSVTYNRATNVKSNLGNAHLIVDGVLDISGSGAFYTTNSGSSVVSNGSGQILYHVAAPSNKNLYEIWSTYGKKNGGGGLSQGSTDAAADQVQVGYYSLFNEYYTFGTPVACTPAKLQNGDDSYSPTAGVAANTTFVYGEGQWLVKKEATKIEVNEKETQVIQAGDQVNTPEVTVKETGTLNVEENAEVVTTNLALSTTPTATPSDDNYGKSSQITGAGTITAQNVYIDITMDASGTLNGSNYYAFAVPFNVNVDDGVQMFKNDAWVACVHDTHYRAYTYDGANRASQGKGSNWVKVANDGVFQPGIFYLVDFADGSCNTFRFTKAFGEDLNNAANIDLAQNASENDADKGWNGIANNSLQNASFSSEATKAQVFEPNGKKFTTIDLSKTTFAIGTPFFIQATGANQKANNSVVATHSAPARMLAQTNDETFGDYAIRIKADGATRMADQMFISANENASSSYAIGKDLVKMFLGNATVAQLWVNDYDKKLSVNQAVLTDNVANASVTLYAPVAGNYTVYLKDIPEDATIYLLENGKAIANLNDGAYTVNLAQGENTQYGLRINAKTIPGVITSMDEAKVAVKLQKVLLNGNVYIIRDGRVYNMFGQKR